MSGSKDQDHIPVEKEEEEKKGPGGLLGRGLAPIGDPLGKGLQTVLSPVGAGLGVVTKPLANTVGGVTRGALGPVTGEEEERAEVIGGKNMDSYEHGKDSLGGRVQTADNPLGLDQSGKWGFREPSKKEDDE